MRSVATLVTALLVCTGCGFNTLAEHASGDDTINPDGGDDASGDGGGGVDADNDFDGDGIPNASDNCPHTANPDQRDWDHDGKGDVCDHCPFINTPGDPDTDGDGVGDPCDPRPTMPGDSIALWNGFYDAASIGSGFAASAGFAVTGGKLVQSSTSGFQTLITTATFNRAYVVSDVDVTATNGSMSGAVITAGDVGTSQSYTCFVSAAATANSMTVGAIAYWTSQQMGFTTATYAGGSLIGTTVRVAQSLQATDTCSFSGAAAAPSQTVTIADGPLAGSVELGTNTAAATFGFLFVVEIGN